MSRSLRSPNSAPGTTESERTRVVRAAELKPPRHIAPEDLEVILGVARIDDSSTRTIVREMLDRLAAEYRTEVAAQELRPDRQADVDRLKTALDGIAQARKSLAGVWGEAGLTALADAGIIAGSIVAEGWLRNTFPDEHGGLPDHTWIYHEIAGKVHARVPPDERDASLPERVCFGYAQAAPLIAALLAEIEGALSLADANIMAAPGARGGRHPLHFRHAFLRDLATVWSGVGLQPTSGPNSKFTAFCAGVLDAIDWPTEGVEAAVADALRDWREHGDRLIVRHWQQEISE